MGFIHGTNPETRRLLTGDQVYVLAQDVNDDDSMLLVTRPGVIESVQSMRVAKVAGEEMYDYSVYLMDPTVRLFGNDEHERECGDAIGQFPRPTIYTRREMGAILGEYGLGSLDSNFDSELRNPERNETVTRALLSVDLQRNL
jgi:hypothetical protein